MRRTLASVVLAAIFLVPTAGTTQGAAVNQMERSATGTVTRNASGWTVTLVCLVEAYGGNATSVKITSCSLKSSGGGSVTAVKNVTAPGSFGVTAGAGSLKVGQLDVCMNVTARYLGGSVLTKNDCNVSFAFVPVGA